MVFMEVCLIACSQHVVSHAPGGQELISHAMVGGNPAMQVIRRTLLEIQSRGGKIHSKLCIQTDNASDNKSKHMFAFLMMLVKEKITDEVTLSMLIVGHTVS